MRLIDADALKERKFVGVATWHAVEADSWQQGWNDAIDTIIEAVPTVDAVPVVRCKDCKHWGMHKSLNVPWCFKMHIDKNEDGYCDSGERSRE